MALGSNQPLTEKGTRNYFVGVKAASSGGHIRIDRTVARPVTNCHECARLSNLEKRRQEEARAHIGLLSHGYYYYYKGGQCVWLTNLPCSCADSVEIWEPEPPGTLTACPGLYRDCFTVISEHCNRTSFRNN
jgi:hypothetical protein